MTDIVINDEKSLLYLIDSTKDYYLTEIISTHVFEVALFTDYSFGNIAFLNIIILTRIQPIPRCFQVYSPYLKRVHDNFIES